jgi:ribonuclease III
MNNVNLVLDSLEKKLGYQFNNKKLLELALRHRSVGKGSNERLEFLGDGVLNFVIASELYFRYPNFKEGELSRFRSNLVKRDSLTELARGFDIKEYLSLGVSEKKSGGVNRPSILADAMEAIIGAIYLDIGFDRCYEVVISWYKDKINGLSMEQEKDAKTRLQECLQAKKLSLPIYEVVSIEGKSHSQTFHIKCSVADFTFTTTGFGKSKQEAEQEAAQKFLAESKLTNDVKH